FRFHGSEVLARISWTLLLCQTRVLPPLALQPSSHSPSPLCALVRETVRMLHADSLCRQDCIKGRHRNLTAGMPSARGSTNCAEISRPGRVFEGLTLR